MDSNAHTDNQPVEVTAPEAISPKEEEAGKSRSGWAALVIFAVIVTVIAWIVMIYNEYVSFYSSIVGLVASVAGAILVGKGSWRNLAITSAVAAGVLAIVFALLWAALSILA